jgi:hypothetical protein
MVPMTVGMGVAGADQGKAGLPRGHDRAGATAGAGPCRRRDNTVAARDLGNI